MDALTEARELFEGAQALERGGDYTAALSRLRAAQRRLAAVSAPDLEDEIALTRARVEAKLRAWRKEIEQRQTAFLARERAESGGAPEREEQPARRSLLDRLLRRRSRSSDQRAPFNGTRRGFDGDIAPA